MPWLMDQTMTQVNQLNISRTLLDSTIRDAVNQRLNDSLRQVNHGGSGQSSRHGSGKNLQRQKSTSSDHRPSKE